ncbi:hypothetical protein KCP78_08720 [Salmonella enterica subsp. enterica]|nr:hypothetical protein KCP78_08720 [Salmonella enterica subsp. enterica]
MRDITRAIAPVLNGIPNRISTARPRLMTPEQRTQLGSYPPITRQYFASRTGRWRAG